MLVALLVVLWTSTIPVEEVVNLQVEMPRFVRHSIVIQTFLLLVRRSRSAVFGLRLGEFNIHLYFFIQFHTIFVPSATFLVSID